MTLPGVGTGAPVWQNKLYLKESNRYRQVDSNDVDLCAQVAGL